MQTATAYLKSVSPFSGNNFIGVPKKEKEAPDDYEQRTWRERFHYMPDGRVFIPPMAFKKSLDTAARFLGMQIKGRGKSTYTKHFKAGVLVMDALVLPIKKDEVVGEWFMVPADGKPGSGSRVRKCFPVVQAWAGAVAFHILDDVITRDIFERHLKEAGNFIGVGRFRPESGGFYGRFSVERVVWSSEIAEAAE